MKLVFLGSLFIVFYVLANILAIKKIDIGPLVVTAGLLTFPITFLLTDAINEVWGKIVAQKIVLYGFAIMAFVLGIIQLAIWIPPASFWVEEQEHFAHFFRGTFRITLASFCAFLISQLHDVWAFDFWGKKTKGKHLWIRNNFSTIASQAIDSVIFVGIAFGGVLPISVLWSMVLGMWIIKWIIAILDTPFCYLLVRWAQKDSQGVNIDDGRPLKRWA